MEDIYTIKVKTSCDPRAKYPSERRYSASTVFGLAWVHLALAATTFLLACLALVSPKDTNLVVSPCLLTIAALLSGLAAILASKRWYIDQNIAWLFAASILSLVLSLTSLCMTATWIATILEESDSSDLFNFDRNRKVLSINILISSILELVWSILTTKIAWNGMRKHYPEDENFERRGGTIEILTEIKGNNTKHIPKNAKILPPNPDLITQYPINSKLKKFFILQQDLSHEKNPGFPRDESNSEYQERMFNFLNRCTSFDQGSLASEVQTNPEFKIPKWGDSPEHTVYDQNTLTLNKLAEKLAPQANENGADKTDTTLRF